MASSFNEEPLSLATFEPTRAFAPYLTTPRSLEACRRCGCKPIELVQLSIDEFRREFPNDPDAAQRRYERIDGARKKLLEDVRKEWSNLCKSNWKPEKSQPPPKEAIIQVPVEAHSTLLEIQAEKFRKIEKEEWKSLQRMLYLQIKNAEEEEKHNKIVQKQESYIQSKQNFDKMISQRRQEALHERFEMQRRKEEEQNQELKRLQQQTTSEAFKKREEDRLKEKQEREYREQVEFDRLQREAYTKQLKESIYHTMESKVLAKKHAQSLRDQEVQQRLHEAREIKKAQDRVKREQFEERLVRMREQVAQEEEERREFLEKQLQEQEARNSKNQPKGQKSRPSTSSTDTDNSDIREKLMVIQKKKQDILDSRAEKILSELEFKELLSKRELDKVKDAQEKRKMIKSIRQESFELASIRKKKADDYRRNTMENKIQEKMDRAEAIRTGYLTLQKMKYSMRDIMAKASLEIKEELGRLKQHNQFSPDKVVGSALQVSEKMLFPNLEKTFGLKTPASTSSLSATVQSEEKNEDDNPMTSTNPGEGGNGKQHDIPMRGALSRAMTAPSMVSGGMMTATNASNTVSSSNAAAAAAGSGLYEKAKSNGMLTGSDNIMTKSSRYITPTLPIESFSKEGLCDSLLQAKKKAEVLSSMEEKSKKVSSHGSRPSHSTPSYSNDGGKTLPGIQSPNHGGGKDKTLQQSQATTSASRLPTMNDNGITGEKSIWSLDSRELPDVGDGKLFYTFTMDSESRHSGSDDQSSNLHNSNNHGSNKNNAAMPGLSGGTMKGLKNPAGGPKATTSTPNNPKAKYLPTTQAEFRREFSSDHPLAGGRGLYTREKAQGLSIASGARANSKKELANNDNGNSFGSGHHSIIDSNHEDSEGVWEQTMDWESSLSQLASSSALHEIEALKKRQNEDLLRVLEQEKVAEESREEALRQLDVEIQHKQQLKEEESVIQEILVERNRLETLFLEERHRASERIMKLTRDNEDRLKRMVLQALQMKGGGIGGGSGDYRNSRTLKVGK